MASDASFVDYIREQSRFGPALASRKMFGEYALYLDGKVVALVCDNQLFLKPTAAGRTLLDTAFVEAPAYPGGKMWLRLDAVIDEPERLQRALQTTADALPVPKPKAPRTARRKAGTG